MAQATWSSVAPVSAQPLSRSLMSSYGVLGRDLKVTLCVLGGDIGLLSGVWARDGAAAAESAAKAHAAHASKQPEHAPTAAQSKSWGHAPRRAAEALCGGHERDRLVFVCLSRTSLQTRPPWVLCAWSFVRFVAPKASMHAPSRMYSRYVLM